MVCWARRSFEVRLKRVKSVGDRRLQHIQHLYDGCSIEERYLNGEASFHVDITHLPSTAMPARETSLSVEYLARQRREIASVAILQTDIDYDFSVGVCELPMLVWVRDVDESLRPLASVARLKLPDRGDVGRTDPLQETLVSLLEPLGAKVDGELRSMLHRARIELGKFVDQIVKRSSQVVYDFSDQNTDTRADGTTTLPVRLCQLGHSIEIHDQVVLVRSVAPPFSPFQVQEVRIGSLDPEVGSTERMRHEADLPMPDKPI